jgi:hypothetical protein
MAENDMNDRVNAAAAHQMALRQQAHGAAAVVLQRANSRTSNRNAVAARLRLPALERQLRLAEHTIEDGVIQNLALDAEPEEINRGNHHHGDDDDDDWLFHDSFGNTSGWSEVDTNGGTPPAPRSLHTAAILNGVMYVFGGYDGNTRVNTFHAFSFAEKRWSPVLPSQNTNGPPSPRDRHAAFAFGNSVYVHGGFDGTSRVADFWGFDLSSMAWREVVVLGGRPPSARHSHSAIVWRNSFYCWGGYDGSYSKFSDGFVSRSSERCAQASPQQGLSIHDRI